MGRCRHGSSEAGYINRLKLHGYLFTADPFISFGGTGRLKHDLRMRYQYLPTGFLSGQIMMQALFQSTESIYSITG